MGYDKQELLTNGIIEQLLQVFSDILVITSRPELYKGVRTAADEYTECGPLAGIHAALKNSHSEYVYVVACDMPEFSTDYVKVMMQKIIANEPQACVTKGDGGKIEPFHAFYGKGLLPQMEIDLKAGLTSPRKMLEKVNALSIGNDIAPNIFFNVNTAADLEKWKEKNNAK